MQNIENLLLFSGEDYLRVSKGLVRTLGVECAFMFAELVDEYLYYYKQKYDILEQNNGWFYSTADNIKERTSWSPDKQEKIIKILIEKNLIQKKLAGVPARRFFYINSKEAQNLVAEYHETSFRKKRKLDSAKNGNLSQENTETIIRIPNEGNLKIKSNKEKDTASGFSSQSSYSEIPNSLTTEESSVSQFQQFWNLYEQPKKVINWNKPNIARQKAFARFKARLKETTFEELMQNVNDYLEYKQIETSGTPKMGVDVFLGGKCFENYRAKINDICKKQGKPLPVAQKTPEKQQEEVEIKKDAQKKREGVLKHLNGEEVQFMKHIKEVLKTNFDVKFHGQWIDDLVFSCRNNIAYFGFTEQKYIKILSDVQRWQDFRRCVMREIATFEGLNAERIELKLID